MKVVLAVPIHDYKNFTDQIATESTSTADGAAKELPIGQGHYFWYRALERLGCQVHVFRYTDNTQQLGHALVGKAALPRLVRLLGTEKVLNKLGAVLANRAFLSFVERVIPDLLLVSGGGAYCLLLETLLEARLSTGAKVAFLSGVSPVVFSSSLERKTVRVVDHVFTNDEYHAKAWMEIGAPKATALPISACDPDFHNSKHLKPHERERYACNVSFVGSLEPIDLYRDRLEFLKVVSDLGLGLWTDSYQAVDVVPELRPCYRGQAHGLQLVKVLSASAISLNIHGRTMQFGGNMRLFEIPACGSLQVVDERPGVHSWFNNGELVTFDSPLDLRSKVQALLRRPKQIEEIAQAGKSHALREHTYTDRMSRLLNIVSN